jgi:hypothetical protein
MIIFQFLNDNIGVVTFVVAFLAIYLYVKQRVDRRRDAASLILQEIRYAEQQIRNSEHGTRGYSLPSKLLPTNSWNDNIHLFIKDLKETQIDMISRFYSQATYIDFLITERSRQKLNQEFSFQRATTPQATPPQTITVEGLPLELTQQQVARLVQIPNPNEQITVELLTNISTSIEYLYNTPAVEKLRKISERKWYHLV